MTHYNLRVLPHHRWTFISLRGGRRELDQQGVRDYEEDRLGGVTVHGDTADLYRYFDATVMAEVLYRWIELAIEEELYTELRFLVASRAARAEIQARIDLPEAKLRQLIRLCLHNGGRLAKNKRKRHFSVLSDELPAELEAIISTHFASTTSRPRVE